MSVRLRTVGGSAVLCSVLTLGCTASSGSQQSEAADAVLFEGARVITGDANAPIEDGAFLVENHRFGSVGRSGTIQVAASVRRVDLTGKTVIPAFVDMHSHVGYENATTAAEEKENFTRDNLVDHLERFAYTGHALTLSLGSDMPDDFVWQLRDESQGDQFTAARYLTVGRGLAWPGTGPVELSRNDTAYPIVSAWQARLAVRELASHKVAFVKLWLEDRGGYQVPSDRRDRDGLVLEHGVPRSGRPYQLTPEIYRAAIDEAKKHGLRTLAHVKTREDLKDMIRAGIDGWTHPIGDLPVDDELLGLLKARPGIWYIPAITPTLSGGSKPRAAGERPAWLSDPLLNEVKCPAYLDQWGASFEKSRRVPGPGGGIGVQNVKLLYDSGVRIALGSHDAGGPRPIGWGTHMELEAFVDWVGMTPAAALMSATSASAQALGVQNDLGTIAQGKSADFVVLDRNPLDDIRNTRRIASVFLRGRELDRGAMRAKWQAACAAAGTSRTTQ
jgi:imidazolonepropionase-like amidohydrolase